MLLLSGGGISVASVHITDFNLTALLIVLFLIVIAIAKLIIHSWHIDAIPESATIMLCGVALAILLFALGVTDVSVVTFNPDVFFIVLIPPIIFEAGISLDKSSFFRNIGTILLYALAGTMFNTICTTLLLWGFSGFFAFQLTLAEAFVFATLVSAVDPVAVIAIFEEVHVNETLNILVFGESVLNDAVSIVLYNIALSLLHVDAFTVDIFFLSIAKFLYVSLGGLFIGLCMGVLCSFVTRYTRPLQLLEPMVIFCIAVLSYLVAEILTASGIVAILFCGIVMSRYTDLNLSESSRETFHFNTRMIASVADSVVFIELGVSSFFQFFLAEDLSKNWDIVMVVWTLVILLPIRFSGVFSLTFLSNRRRMNPVSYQDQFVLGYGGLRGAIAFALAFLLEEQTFEARNAVLTTTLCVIWFTVFVQGATIKPILNILRVKLAGERDSVQSRILPKIIPFVNSSIEGIMGGGQAGRLFKYADKLALRLLVRTDGLEKTVAHEFDVDRVKGSLSSSEYVELPEHLPLFYGGEQERRVKSKYRMKAKGKEEEANMANFIRAAAPFARTRSTTHNSSSLGDYNDSQPST